MPVRRRRPAPVAIDERAPATGLRAIATFEATKGIVVLALGLGLLGFLHKDLESAVEGLLTHLHIDPDRHLSRALLDAASRVTDAQLWAAAGVALVYSMIRFVEAWGLWHRRVWAEWFALLSGALYLPWEIAKVAHRPNLLHVGLLVGNLAVVLYMLYIRLDACRLVPCDE